MSLRRIYLMLLFFSAVWAIGGDKQSGQSIGVVQDGAGHGLPFVSIEIYTKGEVQDLISGGMTDENGNFQIDDVPYGEYELVLTAVGFADKILEIKISAPKIDLGEIILGDEMVTLKGIEIRAETSQYRTEIDK